MIQAIPVYEMESGFENRATSFPSLGAKSKNKTKLNEKTLSQQIDEIIRDFDIADPIGNFENGTKFTVGMSVEKPIVKSDKPLNNGIIDASPINTIDAENKKRITLLIREYVRGNLTESEKSRLEILDEKIDFLIPSVSGDQIEYVEKITKKAEKISSKIDSILSKYRK